MPNEASFDPELRAGDRAGEYVIESRIGQGAYGVVYRAVHPLIGKQAAVKVLGRRFSFDARMTSRFVAEARAVNQIRHPNIIDIFSFGQLPDGRHYHIMELLEGMSLAALLSGRQGLGLEEMLAIVEPLARALDAAHTKGIAHRDLKPANVFLAKGFEAGWYPKLLDFGIANLLSDEIPKGHHTATGTAVGTPYYMSPEQCRGIGVDHRTDIYSFGVMTYELLTGRLPFDGGTALDIFLAHINEAPVPPNLVRTDVPESVAKVVLRMLEKDPARRPATASAAVRAMREALQASATAARMEPATPSSSLSPTPSLPQSSPPLSPSLLPRSSPSPTLSLPPSSPSPTSPPLSPLSDSQSRSPSASLPRQQRISEPAFGTDPGESQHALPTAERPRDGSPRALVAVVVLSAAVVALGGTMLVRSLQHEERAPVRAPDETANATARPNPDPGARERPAIVHVTVRDTPENTEVRAFDGSRLAIAPATFEVRASTVAMRLSFSAPGYRTTTRDVVPSSDLVVPVQLEKLPLTQIPSSGSVPSKKRPREAAKKGRAHPNGDEIPTWDEQPK